MIMLMTLAMAMTTTIDMPIRRILVMMAANMRMLIRMTTVLMTTTADDVGNGPADDEGVDDDADDCDDGGDGNQYKL